MELLRAYLNSLEPTEQEEYAARCGTTIGYLRKGISVQAKFGDKLVIALERESGGRVPVESLRPEVDWAYLRGTSSVPDLDTTQRCG